MESNDKDKIAALLEEIAEDNAGFTAALTKVLDGQAAARSELLRGLDALREDIAGRVAYDALKDLCRELVGPLAAMEAMLAAADFSDPEAIRRHVQSLVVTMQSVLQRMGAEKIPVSPGEDLFDPERHFCVGVVAPDASRFPSAPPRTIVRVVEDGYKLAGRVLAPARVEVQAEPRTAAAPSLSSPESVT